MERLIKDALELIDLAQTPEGPKTPSDAIGVVQAYALIVIAQELGKLNKRLEEVTGENRGRRFIRTYDQSPSEIL